jgi:glucan endo-1,3-alpha-glucosidase
MCGGEWELSLYRYNATSGGSCEPSTPLPSTGSNDTETASPTTTNGVNATATASVTDSTTTTWAATPTSTYPVHDTDTSEWYNLGCAVDSWNRVLSNGGVNDYSLTIDKCLISCEEGGYAYAGLEYGLECWCGNTIASTVEFSADSECDVPCSGNSSEMCGGGFRLDVYQLVSSANGDCETTTSPTSTLDPANNIVLPTGTTSTGTAATTTPTGAVETASPNVPSSSDDHAVYAHHMVGNVSG